MAILAEWKNTLEMFKPKNLKLLSLVVLNAFKQAYKTVVFNFVWWVIAFVVRQCALFSVIMLVMSLLAWLVSPWLFAVRVPQGVEWLKAMVYLGHYSLVFLWCVTIRPSVERKHGRYFLSFMKQFLFLLPLYIFCVTFGDLLSLENSYIFAPHATRYAAFLSVAPILLFALDSNGSFKRVMRAYWQGAKMFLYALPVWVAVALLYRVLAWVLWHLHIAFPYNYSQQKLLENMSFHLLSWLIVPFFVCVMSVIYTKKVHDNSELYN